ncbi:protein tyrosine phosphatase domain-containing protein 1-like [Physella acuta]|uniref:protein tyrosine phosphatase domain-containing protein 1-like n=1 Tax=Physella acuta TaxID=109671 RepID=UPI0027DB50F7|nr:protein tyrosine phosphatase domain-containing protein 1-like [Physella acuta]
MDPDPDVQMPPEEEDLENWGNGVDVSNRERDPRSSYTAFGERARKVIPGESQCKMFCGGKQCKYCTTEHWKPEQMVIPGVYSEWVTDNILAMARLSNANIEKYQMIKSFKEHSVKTVINLQQPGEHAHCGFGNDESGFSYSPQILMENKVYFYNFALMDYGVASVSTLLSIVKVMQFSLSSGKVAVHCHAGLGRTGLIIACFLIFNNRVSAQKAVQYVRSRRPGSIQTRKQLKTCYMFEREIKIYFIIFPSKVEGAMPLTFSKSLKRQTEILHGYEARKLKHIPKVIYVCCERLLELCGRGGSLSNLRNKPIEPTPPDLESLAGCSTSRDLPDSLGNSLGLGDSQDFLGSSSASFSNGEMLNQQANSSSNDGEDDDEKLENGDVGSGEEGGVNTSQQDLAGMDYTRQESSTLCEAKFTVQELCDKIVDMDKSKRTTEINSKVDALEELLNKKDKAWQDLAREDNPEVVCGVLFDWIDQLSEPILTSQDILLLLKDNSTDLGKILLHLHRSLKHFLEYIILVLSKFQPLEQKTTDKLLELFLCKLCQKKLNIGFLKRSMYEQSLHAMEAKDLFIIFERLLDTQKGIPLVSS